MPYKQIRTVHSKASESKPQQMQLHTHVVKDGSIQACKDY